MELSPAVTTEHDQPKIIASQRKYRRPQIDVFTGFRALACLWVFAHHCSFGPKYEFKSLHIEWIGAAGPAGVTLFFSLSGFIMVWIYSDCAFETSACYWSFIGRRVARLFPLYYFSLIISIYDVRCIWTTNKSCTSLGWINIILTLLGITMWIPYNFTDAVWNQVLWTVQTEFFFYVVFPLLLRFIRYLLNTNKISLLLDTPSNKNAMKRLYVLWFLVLCITAIPLTIQLVVHHNPNISISFEQITMLYYSPFTRIFDFILGMLTGIIFILKSSNNSSNDQFNTNETTILISNNQQQQHDKSSSSLKNYFSNYNCHYLALDINFISQIFFFIIIRSPLLFKFHGSYTKYDLILWQGPLISLIMCGDLYFYAKYPLSLTSKLLRTSVFIDMGNISYAFYCLVETLPKLLLLISGVDDNSAIMRLWAGIGIAVFAHEYIEMPIYNWANKKLPKCQCT